MSDYDSSLPRNYYPSAHESVSGLKFRLDGRDVIRDVTDTLRGGVKKRAGNATEYFEERRLLNDLGVERVRLIVQSGVNKVAHLTKYENEERILQQVKSIMKAFIYELTSHAKDWAPKGKLKVLNKRLVVQMVENAIYQSMLRGSEGFEAGLTAKSWVAQEVIDHRQQGGSGGGGFLSRIFRRQPPQDAYGGGGY